MARLGRSCKAQWALVLVDLEAEAVRKRAHDVAAEPVEMSERMARSKQSTEAIRSPCDDRMAV
jgi:hypothetical protein